MSFPGFVETPRKGRLFVLFIRSYVQTAKQAGKKGGRGRRDGFVSRRKQIENKCRCGEGKLDRARGGGMKYGTQRKIGAKMRQ
jgi:hypothetical protein